MITPRASGYAFEASYEHLVLIVATAIIFVALIPDVKSIIIMPIH